MKRNAIFGAIGLLTAVAASLVAPAMVGAQPAADQNNPFQGNAAAAAAGQKLYEANCQGCHSLSGGAAGNGPPIVNTTRNDTPRTPGQLFSIIKRGVPGTAMPAWGDRLGDEDIWRTVSYIQRLRAPAMEAPSAGDPAAGQRIFTGKGECAGCHMVDARGGVTAPDLSNIARIRKTQQIVEALTKPLHRIYPPGGNQLRELPPAGAWRSVKLVTADGRQVSGVLLNQDTYGLQIMGDDQQLHLFVRQGLRSVVVADRSPMPTDYDKRLTSDEFRDLMAYLTRRTER
jgi:putative heme-binding domain-containing protein